VVAVHYRMSTVHSIACCEKKEKNSATDWPFWKQWNVLHNRRFFNSETVAIFFCVQTPNEVVNRNSIARMKCSNESGSLHVWRWTKKRNLSLRITLNNNPRCNVSSLRGISANLFHSNALWRLTWSLSPIYEPDNIWCSLHLCFSL